MAIHPDLIERLKKLREFNTSKRVAEGRFREADAGKKPFFAQLFLQQKELARGKEKVSVAELEYRAYATIEWKSYSSELAKAETEYNYRDLELQIQLNAYYGELSTFKRAPNLQDEGT